MRRAYFAGEEDPETMAARLNLKRFAVSLGIVGAIATPILTGSFKQLSRGGWQSALEDDQQRYLTAHGVHDPFECMLDRYLKHPEPEICEKTKELAGQNLRQTDDAFFNWAPFARLLSDAFLGFSLVFVCVLFVPRIAKMYLGWVTAPPK